MRMDSHRVRRVRGLATVLGFAFLIVGAQGLFARTDEAVTISVEVRGAGPAVVLIPGLSCDGSVWRSTVEHLESRYTCHVVSVRGFGPEAPLTDLPAEFLPRVREDVITYVRNQRIDRPVIVGHSLGGILALEIGKTAPDLPRAMVIVDALPCLTAAMHPGVGPMAAPALGALMNRGLPMLDDKDWKAGQRRILRGMVESQADFGQLARMVDASDRDTVAAALSELLAGDFRAGLERISCPVWVLAAGERFAGLDATSSDHSVWNAQYAALPQVRIFPLPESRHFIMLDKPERFFQILDAMLQEHGAHLSGPVPTGAPAITSRL